MPDPIKHRRWPHVLPAPVGELLALLSGALLPLAFAPFDAYPLAPLCLFGLLVALHGQRPRRAAWQGFLFGVASFLGGVYWVTISIHVFGGAALAFSIALMFALVLYMACYVAAFAYVLNRFFVHHVVRRGLLAVPALWVLLEWLRGWLFSGFGWLSLGYSQTDSALIGLAPVLGMLGMSAVVALTAGAAWAFYAEPACRRYVWLVPVSVWVLAFGLSRIAFTTAVDKPLTVSLVQGAVPQEIKWLPESLQPTVDLYMRLTDGALDSDLVVWPEAAIPTARHNLDQVFAALAQRGERTATDFLLGAVEVERDTGRRLNTVVAVSGTAPQPVTGRYIKRHLVPYGEYFPVPDLVREWIRWMDLPYQDFSSGGNDQPLLRVAGQRVGISICYEDVFGAELTDVLPAAALLVNVSNDAWFGGSVAPHQHLQIARLRAAEAGRMLLRATNTGISAIIDASGRVLARSPQFEAHVLTHTVRAYAGATLYSRLADWPVLGLCVVGVLGCFARNRARPAQGVNAS